MKNALRCFGFGNITQRNGNNSKWRITDQTCLRTFLEGILPFVVYKEDQVRLGIEVLDMQANKEGLDGKWVGYRFSAQQYQRLKAIKKKLHRAKEE